MKQITDDDSQNTIIELSEILQEIIYYLELKKNELVKGNVELVLKFDPNKLLKQFENQETYKNLTAHKEVCEAVVNLLKIIYKSS